MLNKNSKIYIAGHRGMVGSAIWRLLSSLGYRNLVGKTSEELDLRNQNQVKDFFKSENPEIVIDAAARVGGIMANKTFPYQFLYENIQIQNNLMSASLDADCKTFIFLGSSCIYPKMSPQPIKEEYLLTGPLEETNEAYAIAKIAGVKTCESIRKQYGKNFVSLMPTNLYGQNDNFDLETSHVLPAMVRKFHEAKINGNSPVKLWGTGSPRREFLHVDDLAEAVRFGLEQDLNDNLFNVGTGTDISILELANLIQEIIGHEGEIIWDSDKPDGTPRKLLDINKLKNLGWSPKIELKNGISRTYAWFLGNYNTIKEVKILVGTQSS